MEMLFTNGLIVVVQYEKLGKREVQGNIKN